MFEQLQGAGPLRTWGQLGSLHRPIGLVGRCAALGLCL